MTPKPPEDVPQWMQDQMDPEFLPKALGLTKEEVAGEYPQRELVSSVPSRQASGEYRNRSLAAKPVHGGGKHSGEHSDKKRKGTDR